MNNNNSNDMLILGIVILVIGLFVASYSISTYSEIKTLDEKVNFEDIDQNTQMSTTEKYNKYLIYSDFLTQKLDKNKDILMKNASCVYLDYAYHNAKRLYALTKNMVQDESKQNVAAGNVRNLYNTLDNYKTCKQTLEYKSDLKNILKEIQEKELNPTTNSDVQMEKFLNNYSKLKDSQTQDQEKPQSTYSEQHTPIIPTDDAENSPVQYQEQPTY